MRAINAYSCCLFLQKVERSSHHFDVEALFGFDADHPATVSSSLTWIVFVAHEKSSENRLSVGGGDGIVWAKLMVEKS